VGSRKSGGGMREDKDTIKLLYTHISPTVLCDEILRMLQAMPSDDPLMVLWEQACDSNLSSDAISFLRKLADEVITELVHDLWIEIDYRDEEE
jgi:hypothetical protein